MSLAVTAPTPRLLAGLFLASRRHILATYALFNLENILLLAQPYCLGLAISGLLSSSYGGLAWLAAQHLGWAAVGAVRRAYDTRTFAGLYTELATRVVLEQRRRDVAVSSIAARSALSRELVDFFERDVPVLVQAAYSVAGALAMIAWYDRPLLVPCLALAAPAFVLNRSYGRAAARLNRGLNDELEREVCIIGGGDGAEVRAHYGRAAGWRVRLSDRQAANFAGMELFVFALLAASLARTCRSQAADPGAIVAVFRYIWIFVMGLDSVPALVQQAGRLQDIGRRLREIEP